MLLYTHDNHGKDPDRAIPETWMLLEKPTNQECLFSNHGMQTKQGKTLSSVR